VNVSAIIVTRGNVDLQPVLASIPMEWEVLVWNNGQGTVRIRTIGGDELCAGNPDLSVYGRYAAIEYASHDLIYVQDDDVIVSDPQKIAETWWNVDTFEPVVEDSPDGYLVANMPQEFRHDGYTDSCLVGFGACFHRNLPARAFEYFEDEISDAYIKASPLFQRTCDVVFTTLTPRVLVDVPKTDREFASDQDRMWRQPNHYGERVRMLELARQVRDA